MEQLSWGVVQRLCDDEPALLVWREERSLDLAGLAELSGIGIDRLGSIEGDLALASDAEINRLATVLRVPIEYLSVPAVAELACLDE